jgi:TPR repeat protein
MSQLTASKLSRVKSIVTLLEKKDRTYFQTFVGSGDEDDQSIETFKTGGGSAFFDFNANNGVVRDRRLFIEERIRKSRMGTERILPRLRSKKSSKFEMDQIVSAVSSPTNTDNESVCVDFQCKKTFKQTLNIFAEVSPIFFRSEAAVQQPQQPVTQEQDEGPSHSEIIRDFNDRYQIEDKKNNNKKQSEQLSETTEELSEVSSLFQLEEADFEEQDGGPDSILLTNPYMVSPSLAASSLQQSSMQSSMAQSSMILSQMSIDETSMISLANFFKNVIQVTEQVSYQYANILVKNGVANLEVLKRRLLRDQEFLLNLGFDEYISEDVMMHLLKDELANKSSSSASGSSSLSPKALQTNSRFKFEILPSEIAQLYQSATQQDDSGASQKLVDFAFNGNKYAQGFVMRMYAIGQGTLEKNVEQAQQLGTELLPWLKELVATPELANSPVHGTYGKYLLGVCYSEGLGIEKNYRESVYWYRQSADHGYEAAQAYLGYCYYIGQGVVRDTHQAVKYYRLAATQGYAAAQCNLGICFELGDGVPTNLEEAIKWYILAAAQNDSKAQYNLARCYEKGLGVAADSEKAVYYYKLSADQGHPAAQYSMGLFYFNGSESMEQNVEESIFWFNRSAGCGYAPAQCKLGLCYEKGVGVDKDLTQAVYYYQLSADQGEASALYYLGFSYSNGLGVEKDEGEGIRLYKLSADKGYAAAQNNLGYCYFSGVGVPKNYSQAIHWYKKSAEQGYPPAQYNMGFCHEKGLGVPKKTSEMLKWYRLAASQGQKKATIALERIHA